MSKISIHDKSFIHTISDLLAQYKRLVIWHQIPRSGGLSEWFLIQDTRALERIFDRGRIASAFTAFEWVELTIPTVVNKDWLTTASRYLIMDDARNDLLLSQESSLNIDALVELEWIGDLDDLEEYYQENVGCNVFTSYLSWSPDATELARGYYPDENGLPVSAPY